MYTTISYKPFQDSIFYSDVIKNKKINLLNLTYKEMRDFFIFIGEKKFLAKQVMQWIYKFFCDDFYLMTNISIKTKQKLNLMTVIEAPKISKKFSSQDGTIKYLYKIDNQLIETIFIPEKNRNTLCISSQLGCILKCEFCATGKQGFSRNLYVSEIIGQIWNISKITKNPITNIVFMGMGEPLLNFKNIISSLKIMLDPLSFGFSKRRITLSTVGIVPAMNQLYNKADIVLAISLHAPNDYIRNQIIPINKKYNINSVLNSAYCYVKQSHASKGKITIEYVMLDCINDDIKHAYELINLLKKFPCKINLIPWNEIKNTTLNCSKKEKIENFAKILRNFGFLTTIRKNRGNDINAACGQLIGKIENRIKFSVKNKI